MNIKSFTFAAGLLFIIIGIVGFIPGLLQQPHFSDPDLVVDSSYGRLFGLFPVNALHNVVHLILGGWGVVASSDILSARRYCRFNALFYGVLVIMGLIPGLNTFFGLIPIFGHDVWLHALFVAATAYYGYAPLKQHMAA